MTFLWYISLQHQQKVAVLGAAGGIGQPMSLLMKESPAISHLALYDIVNTPGRQFKPAFVGSPCNSAPKIPYWWHRFVRNLVSKCWLVNIVIFIFYLLFMNADKRQKVTKIKYKSHDST